MEEADEDVRGRVGVMGGFEGMPVRRDISGITTVDMICARSPPDMTGAEAGSGRRWCV